jgi:hypothetical protein
MKQKNQIILTPRMQEAVEELKRLITERFPQAVFVVEEGFDPEGIYRLSQKDSWNCKARGIVQMTGNMLVTGENRFLRFNQSEQSLASFTPTNSQVSRASHSNCRAIYSPTKLYLTVYSYGQ